MFKITIIAAAVLMSGCTSMGTMVNDLRDDDYSQGCATAEVKAGIGLYNQNGDLGVCKLKCSSTIPATYKMRYNNPATGCFASVGYGAANNIEPETVVTPQGVRVDVFAPARPDIGLPVDVQ